MPGYNGITLIEKSKNIDPDISFIIVSGYQDFEYAQSALKFGAEDYLLKPVSKEELEQIILKVIEKKTLKKERHKIDANMQKELFQSREILRNQLSKEIVENGCRIKASEVSYLQEHFSVSFQSSDFQIIIFQIDHSESEQYIEYTKAIDTILQKTELSVSSFLKNHVYEILCSHRDFSLIYILNVKNGSGLSFRDLEHLHELATQKISEYGKWRITLCSGKVVNNIELLPESYQDAEFARRDRILRGCGKILEKRVTPPVNEEQHLFDFDELDNRIKRSIESGECSEIQNIFMTSVIPPGISRKIQNPDSVLELFRFSANSFIKQIRKLSADDVESETLLAETEKVLSCAGSIERLSSQLAELYGDTLDNILSSKRVKDYRPIRIAKEYIDKHYSENIDLNIVAKEAGFNPVYFSSLFKKETGINFKEYLLQKRVDSAKELLVSGNDTIMTISENVGYKDVRYFSKIFSKTVGIKPNMYRKIYG
jgi:two-component system, response regulator YesN